jgi:hypothetical protein
MKPTIPETFKYRIEQLEKCQIEVQNKLEIILVKSLPHIQADIASLKTEIRLMSILNVGAIMLGLFVSKIF